jgi:molybdopterin-synthase adenylyltransferase
MNDYSHLTRQADLIPLSALNEKITIIGAGAIGSWTTLALAKMGFTDITVYDDDDVTVENMNCQFYRFADIGSKKVVALQKLVEDFTQLVIRAIPRRYEGEERFPGLVISAVDSMAVRKMIWETHIDSPMTGAVIDPRMGAENAMLFVMCPNVEVDQMDYRNTLYSDDEAEVEPCTAKSTIYCANMLSGLVAKSVKDLVTGGDCPRVAQWSIKSNAFKAWSK